MVECDLLERAMSKRDNKNVHYLTSERRRRSFREFYFPRRHTVLLVAIVVFLAAGRCSPELRDWRRSCSPLHCSVC